MAITYDDEAPAAVPKPKITYEERRAEPAAPEEKPFLEKYAPFYLGPLGPLRAMQKGSEVLDKIAYKAGGLATDAGTAMGMEPENAAKLGYVANVATQAIPTFGAGPLGAKLAPMFESGARRVMQSALKPTRSAIDSGKAGKAITTMLDEGINATRGGADILQSKVNVLQNEMADIISRHAGAQVDQAPVFIALQDAVKKAMLQGTPQDDITVLRKAAVNFANHPLLQNSATIPIDLAQQLKQGVWRKLGEKSFGK